jgi:hypothetical protein
MLSHLNLPRQEELSRPNPYLRVKTLKLWLLSLPKAKPLKATASFIQQLDAISASRYPVYERILLVDTLRPAARQLIVSLKKITKTASLPLSEEARQAYRLLQDVNAVMATGYKLIFSDLSEVNNRKEHDELEMRGAIYLAMQYMSRQLVEAYLVYAQPPKTIWQELHHLYQFADESGITDLPVDDPYPDFSLPTQYTIDLAYKRILLLALAEPYHMVQGEADDIYYLLSAWTKACSILNQQGDIADNNYIVDMGSDNPPHFYSHTYSEKRSHPRILDISEVKKRLDIHLERLLRHSLHVIDHNDAQTLIERQQRDMLLRLSEAWNGNLIRQSERQPCNEEIRIASGLNASHYYISAGKSFTPETDEFNLKNDEINPTLMATTFQTAKEKDHNHQKNDFNVLPWWQSNTSESGRALSCMTNCEKTHVKVGDLISYQVPIENAIHWNVGVIRWLKTIPGNKLEIGMMCLSSSAVPVAVKALNGAGFGTDYFRGLLIPKQISFLQTRSILVPPNIYDVHTELAVNMKNKLFYVRLSTLQRATNEFNQFTFEVLERQPLTPNQFIEA